MTTSAEEVNVLHSTIMCRTCMAGDSESVTLTPLAACLEDDASIASVVAELTAVQVMENDGLPEHICVNCTNELKRFVEFIKMVRKTDRMLRQIFKNEIKIEDSIDFETFEVQAEDKLEELQIETVVEEEYLLEDTVWEVERIDSALEIELVKSPKSEKDFFGFEDDEKHAEPSQAEISIKTDTSEDVGESDELDEVEQKTFKVLSRSEGDFLCCACFHIFYTEDEFIKHCKTHDTKANMTKSNVCEICFRRYKTRQALALHRKHSKATTIFECVRCYVRFVDVKRRRQHAHNHPQREILKSSVLTRIPLLPYYRRGHICCAQGCGLSFPSDEQLIAHAHAAHLVNKYDASLPDKRQKPYECAVCYKRFDNRNALRMHQRRKYKQPPRQCSICGFEVRGSVALAAHEQKHTNEKPFQCDLCDKKFANRSLLKAHSVIHTNNKMFVCSTCGAAFQRKATMQNHELLHMDQLPYLCDLCPRAFRVKYKLEMHKRSHTGLRPYPCRFCEKSFADHSNRSRHEMSHTGIKPYKCSYCDKTFITKRLRADHEGTHRPK
ncbi:zinc finger protein 624-like [Malaya genurostris]|uniref:zinc finger protein 624-like n=1 Tax=Malaya genurostris TaxID=325434 RepID=UPI0026F3CF70|nr:zinc finger protein 624-like [Malaya genurostris]